MEQQLSPRPSKTFDFLSLPFELRITIYKHLLSSRAHVVKDSTGYREFEIFRFKASGPSYFSARRVDDARTCNPTVFKSLRLCSRQILQETQRYIRRDRICLKIDDNRLLTFCSAPETYELLHREKWIWEWVEEVQIKISWSGITRRCPIYEHNFLNLRDFIRPHRNFNTYEGPFNWWAVRRGDLKQMAKFLLSFPQLKRVALCFTSKESEPLGSPVGWNIWRDPLADAEAFLPLRENGVAVGIEFDWPYFLVDTGCPLFAIEIINTWGERERAAFQKMLRRKRFWRRMRGVKTDEQAEWNFLDFGGGFIGRQAMMEINRHVKFPFSFGSVPETQALLLFLRAANELI